VRYALKLGQPPIDGKQGIGELERCEIDPPNRPIKGSNPSKSDVQA